MFKSFLLVAACAGVALSRPGSPTSGLSQESFAKALSDNLTPDQDTAPADKLGDDPTTTTTPPPPTSSKPSTGPWYDWPLNHIKLSSMGSLDSDPGNGGDLGGKTYHKLSLSLGEDKDYVLYLDHILKGFKAGNGGDLGLGFQGPLAGFGDINLRASQGIGGTGAGTFDWRLDFDHQDS